MIADSGQHRPAFILRIAREESRLFTFCRALCECLESANGTLGIVDRAHSWRQKRNRAFAAEFLVPAEGLRAMLPDNVLTDEDLDDLGDRFGVSSHVIRHQIENHSLAAISNV
ncbi:MAG: ImmA/IrrE family metallo-endopeptidase [Armatimonadetes bacterium]|nr:ImmA/IrrE family metallo-endopeptidase [Armatimonadota bacterium]